MNFRSVMHTKIKSLLGKVKVEASASTPFMSDELNLPLLQDRILSDEEEFPPAARLVGVELNPGPQKPRPIGGKSLASDISAAAFNLGKAAALAQMAKGKKKKVGKSKKGNNIGLGISMSQQSSNQPLTRGTIVRPTGRKNNTFIMCGSGFSGSIFSDAGSVCALRNGLGNGGLQAFTVDPVGVSTTQYNWKFFPDTVVNVAKNFIQYRLKKLVLRYVPSCSSTTTGTFFLGVSPEVVAGNFSVTLATVSSLQNMVGFNAWQPVSLDLMADGGLRNDFLFVDSTVTSSESGLRQEAPGTLCMAYTGAPASTTFGILYIDYEIEFKYVGVEAAFEARQPSTGPSSIPVQPTLISPKLVYEEESVSRSEEESKSSESLGDSVYIPSALVRQLGLRR